MGTVGAKLFTYFTENVALKLSQKLLSIVIKYMQKRSEISNEIEEPHGQNAIVKNRKVYAVIMCVHAMW